MELDPWIEHIEGLLRDRLGVCLYAFMRTTVDVPSDLLRRAKALAAARGESLKALFTRAVAAEVGAASDGLSPPRQRVALPLFGDPSQPKVSLTSEDIAGALAKTDAQELPRRPSAGA